MEVTTEVQILNREQAITLINAMREEVREAKSYCERYQREKEERDRAANPAPVA